MDTSLLREILPVKGQVLEHFGETDWSFFSRQPRAVLFPHSQEEITSVLSLANENNWNCMPAGNGTWLEGCMNTDRDVNLIVSMSKMNNILVHEPDNLFVELEAGVTLEQLQVTLRPSKQWLPLDPPGKNSSTMGAIIATSSCGALQTGFGRPRDHVLGATLITGDGKTLKLGGKTVKNVAGFDLLKLLSGSWGRFGVITKLIMRLHPLPEADRTLLFSSNQAHPGTSLAHDIMHTPATLQSISILSPGLREELDSENTGVAVRILESEAAVDKVEALILERTDLLPCKRLNGSESEAFFESLKNTDTDSDVVIRIKCLPSIMKNLIHQIEALQSLVADDSLGGLQFLAHYESGILLVLIDKLKLDDDWLAQSAETLQEFRDTVEQQGGSLTLLFAPEILLKEVTPWGSLGEVETICAGLEKVFDPNQILSRSSAHRSAE